jgi:hypothetical protein
MDIPFYIVTYRICGQEKREEAGREDERGGGVGGEGGALKSIVNF